MNSYCAWRLIFAPVFPEMVHANEIKKSRGKTCLEQPSIWIACRYLIDSVSMSPCLHEDTDLLKCHCCLFVCVCPLQTEDISNKHFNFNYAIGYWIFINIHNHKPLQLFLCLCVSVHVSVCLSYDIQALLIYLIGHKLIKNGKVYKMNVIWNLRS